MSLINWLKPGTHKLRKSQRRRVNSANSKFSEALEDRVLLTFGIGLPFETPIDFELIRHGLPGGLELPDPDAEFGNDVHADEIGESATELSEERYVFSNIDSAGDVDVFQFAAPATGTFTIAGAMIPEINFERPWELLNFEFSPNLNITVTAANGDVVGTVDPGLGFGEAQLTEDETYFLEIAAADSATGQYAATFFAHEPVHEYGPDAEFGDDIHSNEIGEAATELDEDLSVHSHIDATGDVDVFSFVAPATDNFQITGALFHEIHPEEAPFVDVTSGLEVSVIGSDGDVISSFDFTSGFGEVELMEGNAYFLSVSASHEELTGEYVVNVAVAPPRHDYGPDAEFGDDIHPNEIGDTATELDEDLSVHSHIDAAGDVDVFSFVAPATDNFQITGALFHEIHPEEAPFIDVTSGLEVSVIGSDGDVISSFDFTSGFGEVELMEGNAYFLSVSASHEELTGEYVVNVAVAPPRHDYGPDAEFGDDIHPNEIGDTATVLSEDLSVHSHIDEAGDVDVFSFVAEQDVHSFTFTSFFRSESGRDEDAQSRRHRRHHGFGRGHRELRRFQQSGGLNVTVLTADGTVVSPESTLEFDHYDLEAGETYFLSVSAVDESAVGTYLVNALVIDHVVQPREDQHVNEAGPEATVLEFNDAGDTRIRGAIETPGDVDAFQFVAPVSDDFEISATAFVRGMGRMPATVAVLDSDGEIIADFGPAAPETDPIVPDSVIVTLTEGQTYFVTVASVDADSTGRYALHASRVNEAEEEPETDPGTGETDPDNPAGELHLREHSVIDIDGDGQVTPLSDGILMLRYMAGFRGNVLVGDIVDGRAGMRTGSAAIEEYLERELADSMDIDGDGEMSPLVDGIMMIRQMAGFGGSAIVNGFNETYHSEPMIRSIETGFDRLRTSRIEIQTDGTPVAWTPRVSVIDSIFESREEFESLFE